VNGYSRALLLGDLEKSIDSVRTSQRGSPQFDARALVQERRPKANGEGAKIHTRRYL
jgi:hypothetical protein